MSEQRRTSLYDWHKAHGAKTMEFAGWDMPIHYGSIVEEHRAVRACAGAFDVSHMGEIEISGEGADDSCQRLFSNDVRKLSVGRAQYNLLIDDAGRVLDDVILYKLGHERYMVCTNAVNAERDFASIAGNLSPRTDARDLSDDLALIAFQGPRARELGVSLASELSELKRFDVAHVDIRGMRVLAAATGYTGEDGFEFFVEWDKAVELWDLLLGADSGEDGAVPVGLGARDTLRLEAALPLYGHELSETITPYEAGVGWAVKLTRPDQVGFAALSELAGREPERRLIGLEVAGGVARHGYSVLRGGDRVGVVTSGSHCPTLGKPVALALVAADAIDDSLSVEIRGRACGAVVTSLPFYVRQR